jgi:hypothetical protein
MSHWYIQDNPALETQDNAHGLAALPTRLLQELSSKSVAQNRRLRPTNICALNLHFLSSELLRFYSGDGVKIQGDSGGICITLENDSMSDSKQKIHTNMGPNLNGYGVMTA